MVTRFEIFRNKRSEFGEWRRLHTENFIVCISLIQKIKTGRTFAPNGRM